MSIVKRYGEGRVEALAELTSKNEDTIENLEQTVKELKQERKELKEVCRIAQYVGDEDDALISLEASASKVEERIKALDSKAEKQLKSEVAELQGRRDSFLEVYFPRHSQLSEEYHKLKSTEADLKDELAYDQSISLDDILEANPEILSVVNILNEKIEEYVSARTKYDSEMDAILQGEDCNRAIIETILKSGSELDRVVYCLDLMAIEKSEEEIGALELVKESGADVYVAPNGDFVIANPLVKFNEIVGDYDNLPEGELIRVSDDEIQEAITWAKRGIELKSAFGKEVIIQLKDKLNEETYTQLRESYVDMKEKENIPTSVFVDMTDGIGNFLTEYKVV
jgi:hypothetical protein